MHKELLQMFLAGYLIAFCNACGRSAPSCPEKRVMAGERIWKFAVSANKRPYNYIDENGELKGFDIDLITAVCNEAKVKCIIEKQNFTLCGTTDANGNYVPGTGLLNERFDACTGRAVTADRLKVFKFTIPYYSTFGHFFVKAGNPDNFDENNVAGKTIALLTGLYTDAKCLEKFGKSGVTYKVGKRITTAVSYVLNGQADAIFVPRKQIDGLDRLAGNYDCTMGGSGMMTLKTSDLESWWNVAFKAIKASGKYKEVCEESGKKHGGTPECIF